MPIAGTAGARSDGSAAAAVLALAAFERWARQGKRRVITEGRIQRLGSRYRKARSASAARVTRPARPRAEPIGSMSST